jgi:hypothetical protein
MTENRFLTKNELNERFYGAVDPESAFGTEVQVGFHQVAVARLVSSHAASRGRTSVSVLELGASTCLFAEGFLQAMGHLAALGETGVEQVAYTAVDYSELALETALRGIEQRSGYDEVEYLSVPPAREGIETLASLRRREPIVTELSLVHAEAQRFVGGDTGRYDVVLLNELLDDLPCRVFFADRRGRRHELTAHAYRDGPLWRVRFETIEPDSDVELDELPPGTLTASSAESVRLLRGIVELLEPGGVLLVHDYGFTERFASVRQYAEPQPGLPPFAVVEGAEGEDVPRSFFRVYGNEAAGAIQLTSDVAFAELARALEPSGTVVTIPHGNTLVQSREWPQIFFAGDGVFLSEFVLHTAGDDLHALLASLRERQQEAKERYSALLGEGRTSMLTDLIFVKA